MSLAIDHPLTDTADALNTLLRNELAAVETYTRAIGLFNDPDVIERLQNIRDAHRRAERELRDGVVRGLGVPAAGAGVWDAFAAVASTGKAVGGAAVLAALRRGEEYAVGAYEDALSHADLHSDFTRLIGASLLPAAREHVDDLNRLLAGSA